MSTASPAILSNFFEKQWAQNHPQYLSGLSRALFLTTFLEIAVYMCKKKQKQNCDHGGGQNTDPPVHGIPPWTTHVDYRAKV